MCAKIHMGRMKEDIGVETEERRQNNAEAVISGGLAFFFIFLIFIFFMTYLFLISDIIISKCRYHTGTHRYVHVTHRCTSKILRSTHLADRLNPILCQKGRLCQKGTYSHGWLIEPTANSSILVANLAVLV